MESYIFTDEEYGKVLDNIVVGCVDVAVIYDNHILLEKRQFNPIQGEWWIFGGRILVGEDLKQAAQRNVLRELQIEIAQDRFSEIATLNLRWPLRREPVIEHGCHHLLIAHVVELTEDEKLAIDATLASRQQEIKWFQLNVPSEELLPEMQTIVASVKGRGF